jgi:hypothetical protein
MIPVSPSLPLQVRATRGAHGRPVVHARLAVKPSVQDAAIAERGQRVGVIFCWASAALTDTSFVFLRSNKARF